MTNVGCDGKELLAHLGQTSVINHIKVANDQLAVFLDGDLSIRKIQVLDLVQEQIIDMNVECTAEKVGASYAITVTVPSNPLGQVLPALGAKAMP